MNVPHIRDQIKLFVCTQKVSMHIKLTHQMLGYHVMDSDYKEELYRILDLMTNILLNTFQIEEKKFLMKEQGITRSWRATCHYLLCQAKHMFSFYLQFQKLSFQPFYFELLLCIPQS